MPDFGSSFSGLANDRKLTDEELIRAIRFMIAAEYEATQLYTPTLQNPVDPRAPKPCVYARFVLSHHGVQD